ncbi:MAG TPA: alpha-amylase family glycosyl hydrolase, partial [Rubrivivax sp.]|nr:alpha-amylase family glycosyl hydrolase [Rubrivivax sp.]
MKKNHKWHGAVLGLALSYGLPVAFASPPLKLHVPSPDWRDQVIYLVMTDRFADGDAGNNDQGHGEFKAGDASRYNGGDLRGLIERLPYIRGLGATAVWITPPVANQWLEPAGQYSGYHGYWAQNLLQVDRHLGSLADYQQLSHALHTQGMYLVQDIVVNHMGNYFGYQSWKPRRPALGWQGFTDTAPTARPTQPPFHLNDPRQRDQRQAAIYHWTPDVADYTQRTQELN